jgi:monoterpene epsilon-lactone hydrolase
MMAWEPFLPWALPPERPGRPASPALIEGREGLAKLAAAQLAAPGVSVRSSTVGTVRCIEAGRPDDPILLYIHGGGFRMGEAATWTGFATRLAEACRMRVLVPDYRLAPEYPFPAGLTDLACAYETIVAGGAGRPIVAGDSAGGGLACSLAIAARDAGIPMPRALVLLSPWLDLTLASDTYRSRAGTDRLFSRDAAAAAAATYLQGVPADLALVSPLAADLTGFPHTLVIASQSEVLAGDSLGLIGRLADYGVSVEAWLRPGLPHVWPVITPAAPETEHAIARIGNFAQSLVAR